MAASFWRNCFNRTKRLFRQLGQLLVWLFLLLWSLKIGTPDLEPVSWHQVGEAVFGRSEAVPVMLLRHLLLPRGLIALLCGVLLVKMAEFRRISRSGSPLLLVELTGYELAGVCVGIWLLLAGLLPETYRYCWLIALLAALYRYGMSKCRWQTRGLILLGLLVLEFVSIGIGQPDLFALRSATMLLTGSLAHVSSSVWPALLLQGAAALLLMSWGEKPNSGCPRRERLRQISGQYGIALGYAVISAGAGILGGLAILAAARPVRMLPAWWYGGAAVLLADVLVRQNPIADRIGVGAILSLGLLLSFWHDRHLQQTSRQ